MRFQIINRAAIIRLGIFATILIPICIYGWDMMIRMPGESYKGKSETHEASLRDTLKSHINKLAGEIGPRNLEQHRNLTLAAKYIEASLSEAGYKPRQQKYEVNGLPCWNIDVEIKGTTKPDEIVIIGAHYDSVEGGCPGANDNGSGAAAVLALAHHFKGKQLSRTLRFVEFVNEEPPYFQTDKMGSVVYAKQSRQKNENIVAMISIETIGYYTDEKDSQKYPRPFNLFYPSTGNFIGFVGNTSSEKLVKTALALFRQHAKFPSEGVATWDTIPGVGWSDHWAFWKEDYPGIMITDTAPFRYPHYHTENDTPDKLDYDKMAIVVEGLEKVIAELVNSKE